MIARQLKIFIPSLNSSLKNGDFSFKVKSDNGTVLLISSDVDNEIFEVFTCFIND